MEFAKHLNKALIDYEQRNKILRWKMIVNLEQFGGNNIELKTRNIPIIDNPYKDIDWNNYDFLKANNNKLYILKNNYLYFSTPQILSINVNNYQGKITIVCLDANKIEWFLDDSKIKTKYNVVGKWTTTFSVENLKGNQLNFKLTGDGGEAISKKFALSPAEVI